jgi:hypothetical protein
VGGKAPHGPVYFKLFQRPLNSHTMCAYGDAKANSSPLLIGAKKKKIYVNLSRHHCRYCETSCKFIFVFIYLQLVQSSQNETTNAIRNRMHLSQFRTRRVHVGHTVMVFNEIFLKLGMVANELI